MSLLASETKVCKQKLLKQVKNKFHVIHSFLIASGLLDVVPKHPPWRLEAAPLPMENSRSVLKQMSPPASLAGRPETQSLEP